MADQTHCGCTNPAHIPRVPQTALDVAHYILSTAVESGTVYWFQLTEPYKWTDNPFRVAPVVGREYEVDENDKRVPMDDKTYTVTGESLLEAMKRLRDDEKMPKHWRVKCAEFFIDPDGTDFDAEAADVVFQYAVLGEIVYG